MKYIAIGIISAIAAAVFCGLTYQEATLMRFCREHGGRHHVGTIIFFGTLTVIAVANIVCCIVLYMR